MAARMRREQTVLVEYTNRLAVHLYRQWVDWIQQESTPKSSIRTTNRLMVQSKNNQCESCHKMRELSMQNRHAEDGLPKMSSLTYCTRFWPSIVEVLELFQGRGARFMLWLSRPTIGIFQLSRPKKISVRLCLTQFRYISTFSTDIFLKICWFDPE